MFRVPLYLPFFIPNLTLYSPFSKSSPNSNSARDGRSLFHDLGPGPIPFLYATVSPSMPLIEATRCLVSLGIRQGKQPHSHHRGYWGTQKQLWARECCQMGRLGSSGKHRPAQERWACRPTLRKDQGSVPWPVTDLRAHELARKALVQESEDLAVAGVSHQPVCESSLSF